MSAKVPSKSKALKRIPTSKLSRGFKLAQLTASVGTQALTGKLTTLFADKAQKEIKTVLSQVKQAQKIVETLSQMKGAAMKLGQILSLHGEDLFPKEVTAVLSKLQQHSDEMEFAQIEKVLKAELGPKYGKDLIEVSARPIASASIGQVHGGTLSSDEAQGIKVAVKVQYPGVDKSIDSDVDSLASLFSVLTRFPNAEGFNSVTDEVKELLRQETDYLAEGEIMESFRKYFARKDSSVVIPKYFDSVGSKRVLVTELVSGITVQEFSASTASQNARDFLGRKYLEVFYNELFNLGMVQTDPNFANYKIQWSFGIQEPKLVLLDFGATKRYSEAFRCRYKEMLKASLDDDYEAIRQGAIDLGFLREEDSKELVELHYQLLSMFLEPFRGNGPFRWYETDLASRIRKFMPKFIFAFKLRPPPKDFVFLTRKISGVYFFASAIRSEFNPRPILESFLV